MATVKKVSGDRFEVSNFVMSMTHLRHEVLFEKGEPRVVARTGCIGPEWDRHAISAVQTALIRGEVAHAK